MTGRKQESGFALMLILAMASVAAIMLYMELPRVEFEAQRDREQLLIDHGEQYSRAIQLFVRKFNRYPADFDALENTQSMRFLRRRYTDPMAPKKPGEEVDARTGGWRLVHVGPGGVFTDSLVYNVKKTGDQAPAEKSTFIADLGPMIGTQADPSGGSVNIADRRRPSDQAGAPGTVPGDPNNPVAPVPVGGLPVGGDPNNPVPQPPFGSQLPPGIQLPPGVQIPGVNAPAGQGAGGPPSAATSLINNLLTTPRPGGLAGLGGAPTVDQNGNAIPQQATGGLTAPAAAAQPATQQIGGGIAGVASNLKQEGIKVYKDQKPYNKWEFVYDITQDKSRGGGGIGAAPQPPAGAAPPTGAFGATGATTSPATSAAPGSTLGTTSPTTP